jgi:DinB superfamily
VSEVLQQLRDTPLVVEAYVDVFQGDVRQRPEPDWFSFLENICHLRDIERFAYTERIARMLAEVDPGMADVDGAKLAAEADYHATQDVHAALASFIALRNANVARLESLTDEQWARGGTIEGAGHITLRDLAAKMADHDRAHLEELRRLTGS